MRQESTTEIDADYFEYLDDLRDSGATNMFGATPYLQAEFPELSKNDARQVLTRWMQTFGERPVMSK